MEGLSLTSKAQKLSHQPEALQICAHMQIDIPEAHKAVASLRGMHKFQQALAQIGHTELDCCARTFFQGCCRGNYGFEGSYQI